LDEKNFGQHLGGENPQGGETKRNTNVRQDREKRLIELVIGQRPYPLLPKKGKNASRRMKKKGR